MLKFGIQLAIGLPLQTVQKGCNSVKRLMIDSDSRYPT